MNMSSTFQKPGVDVEESNNTRSRQDKNRTPEESSISSRKHTGSAFHILLSERNDPIHWKTSTAVLLFKKDGLYAIGNYRPICLLTAVYKLFTRVIVNKINRTLDERQPCEQAGFRKGFSTMDHIHTITKLI
ncbi:unnamed protein product [Angiostrongylus costaricensis]|uniref:Reverse transcriptase domain-containing protein n=1 Tax=Angiostrongylus costaricensis TaxID=334426 RepID=A0A0R3PK29_ANGCS|nr:unnamed protein product [Angiostrongylus costaricensis]